MRCKRSLFMSSLLTCVLAIPAQAQFRLPKVKISTSLGSMASSNVRTGKVEFSDVVLEVTDANMTRFLKGLAAESATAKQLDSREQEAIARRNRAAEEQYQKQKDEYDRQSAKWDKCAEPLQEQGQMSELEIQATEDSAALRKLAERVQAAQRAGNLAEIRRLADSMSKSSLATASTAQVSTDTVRKRITDKCGIKPQEPARPELEPEMTGEAVREAGISASGMTTAQYNVFRERVAPYVMSDGEQASGYVYTKDEVAVLKSHLGELKSYQEILKSY